MSTLTFTAIGRDQGASRMLKEIGRNADVAARKMQTLDATSKKANTGMGGITKGIDKVGVGLGVAGAAAVGFGLKVASGNEQARISFTTMLGSAQKADVLLRNLQKFAATTPFEFPEIADASKKLLAFGFTAQEIEPNLRSLGDLAAGLNVPLGELTDIYGKARVQGRLFMEDINQLTGRGIPVIQEFAKQFGVSEDQVRGLVETGKIGFPQLQKAMQSMTGEGGQFAGMMEAQSKSLAGMISTLKDDLGQGLAGAMQGLFPILKASIGAWNDLGSGTKATLGIIAGSAVAFGVAASGAVKLAGAFRTLGLSAGAAKIAVGGVGAALGIATFAFGLYATSHAKAEAHVDDFTQALEGETNALNRNVRVVAAKQLQDADALKSAELLGLSLEEVTAAALGEGDALQRIQPLLDGYVAAGVNGSIADQDRATAAGKVNDAIKAVGGSYNKAVQESKQMNAATGGVAGSLAGAEKKAISAKEALQKWRAEMFKSSRTALDLAGSEDAVEQAIDDATQAVKDNGKTLDNNTEKGRNNRAALRNLASSSLDYREKLIKQGASQKRVTETTNDARSSFIKTAQKMGATREEARKLADKFGLVDKKINELNNKTVKTKVTFSVSGSGFKIHIPNSLSVVKDMGGGQPGPVGDQTPLTISHSHGHGRESGGPVVHPKIATNRFTDPKYTADALRRSATGAILNYGYRSIKSQQDQFAPPMTGPSGSVGAYSAGQAATIARLRAAGARSFTTYPGHHPSMARARDVTPHSWKIANTARASSGVWYVIYNMRIASKNHGNTWRPYIPHNHHGDWQHRRHVHVAWYDKGGLLPHGGMAVNGTGRPERVLTPAQTQAYDKGAGNTYIVNAPNYVGDKNDLVKALTDLDRQGRLAVVRR